MRIEAALYAELTGNAGVKALVSTRVYPLRAPQDATLPYLIYQKISNARDYSHDGATLLVHPRFQFKAVSTTFDGSRALFHAVRAVLSGYSGTMGGVGGVSVNGGFLENEYDQVERGLVSYEPELGAYVTYFDFFFRHQEAAS